jgi:hypothetical protein
VTSAYSADPVFEANGKLISYLLQRIYDRELALPDFQRDFVWDAKATAELLRSIMSRFPAGTLLFWKQGSETASLASREVEGAPSLDDKSPDELVLDGQQRLTALYRALTGSGDDKFYADLGQYLRDDGETKQVHEVDFEKAIRAFDLTAKLNFDPEDREYQFTKNLFPLAKLPQFDEWLDDYARRSSTDDRPEHAIKRQMRSVRDTFLVPLRSYGFPVVTLPATTPLEAVCNIFETLNRTGKPLGAFDLVTARLFPQSIRLRDLWEEARESYSIIEDFEIEAYAVLQSVCLRARGSAQRADVLTKIDAADITAHWLDVIAGFAGVLNFLRSSHGVATKRWLPYGMILVPMAAAWPEVKVLKPLERAAAENKLSQFFWCTTFMTNYDQGANSQAGADYGKLKSWLFNEESDAPEAVAMFNLAESTLRQATVRRKALHAGVMALTIRSGAKDFYSGETMNAARIKERRIDSHHIFPKAYLSDLKLSELLLNRSLIDSETNKIIGKIAPSEYLSKMATVHDPEKISDVLESHAIDPSPTSAFRKDDYEGFLTERLSAIVELVENSTGKPVVRDVSSPESSPA